MLSSRAAQVSWELMRSEGGPHGAGARVGVYVGIQQMEYGSLAGPFLERVGPFSATGGPFSVAAGRLSFTYGLRGPAVRHAQTRSCKYVFTRSNPQDLGLCPTLTVVCQVGAGRTGGQPDTPVRTVRWTTCCA